MTAIRAQGAGGQKVDKVSNAVHLRFDIDASPLPNKLKARLLQRRDQRINTDGVVVNKAQAHRSLERNRVDALVRVRACVDCAGRLHRTAAAGDEAGTRFSGTPDRKQGATGNGQLAARPRQRNPNEEERPMPAIPSVPIADLAMTAADVLSFWFEETSPAQWWAKSDDFDRRIEARFGILHAAAMRGELYGWRDGAAGRLAEIIVLDQFSRNIHRGLPAAFAGDGMALVLAQEAVAAGLDRGLAAARRAFLYLPFMHSESLLIQSLAIRLFSAPGMEKNLDFALRHRAIIERFGRYPHRNAILGRPSTAAELEFLETPGSAF